ncbi:3-hydroxyisobutyrate dehydrogenase-like beta-hydroxyacid dehydrogenase [Constrictibacter sp. MBR-5]|jgi:3-hydroxyisobutyrate dehydrogenase|uniref:NAD(P)-dependent oxidoreductase n=1 Tax=Constrictibacter sp. MBR-5 TaxID=3156467 RepID=UPI00339916F7
MDASSRVDAIGFVGLGVMGGGMAANLMKRGRRLVVHDLDPAKCARFAGMGATVADGAMAVARQAATTICMVETTAQAEAVIVGPGGFIAGAQPGDTVLCMSTIDPLAAKAMHERLATMGVAMLDAPVSGGEPRAVDGTLSVIVGGDAAVVEACRPIFDAVGTRVFHMGGVGQGLAMKLVNNMLIQVGTVAVAEAMVMGAKAGLDPQAMIDVVRESTGASVAFEMRAPRYVSGDFRPGGTIDISYKDQELQTAFAKALGVPLFLANITEQIYQMGRAAGLAKEDSSALVKLYEKMAGVQLGPRD